MSNTHIHTIIKYRLIKTNRRLTFDILEQDMRFCGKDDDDYLTFRASNGVEIISRSRMDIQTDRLWFIGCKLNERSGSMVFSSNEKRDREYERFQCAIDEWAKTIPLPTKEILPYLKFNISNLIDEGPSGAQKHYYYRVSRLVDTYRIGRISLMW